MTDDLTPAEQYRREAFRLYSLADFPEQSVTARHELFRMARMYEALSLQADQAARRGLPHIDRADDRLQRQPG